MSDGDNEESWDDWAPKLEDAEAERFKWGWNGVDGEVVWRVGGPGDGLPAHAEQLMSAWGRDPSPAAGDVLGAVEYVPSRASEAAVVVIRAYYGETAPPSSSTGSGVRSKTLNCASQGRVRGDRQVAKWGRITPDTRFFENWESLDC